MKNFFTILFVSLICSNIILAQTNANIPGPENVLVVYRQQTGPTDTLALVSDSVMQYYVSARNIPISNILGLDSLDVSDTVSYPSGNVYMDDYKEVYISDYNKAAWECYVDKIATPIENYLNSTYVNGVALKNSIRYIVMCKGVPMKLLTYLSYMEDENPLTDEIENFSYFYYRNVSIDALSCLLYQPVINLYNTSASQPNPYKDQADMSFNFNKRFITNYFINQSGWKLNYLVTRLDGDSYADITGMIDRAMIPDYSGKKWWVFDADTCHNTSVTKPVDSGNYLQNSLNNLKSKGFYTNPNNYDPDCNFILDNAVGSNEQVIGYSSCGYHSWIGLACSDSVYNPAYIQDCLDFDYSNGAIFNTFESWNGFSMYISNRYSYFGMISEFIKMGGTVGVAHSFEPRLSGVALNDNLFNLYQMGYSFADAAYQSIPYIAWNNVVIGDPLTAIAWGKQTLTEDVTMEGTNLVTGEINVQDLKTLTIANNSVINLKHQGFITGEGKLIIGQNVIFNIHDWHEGLFLSYDGANPRLVWGSHPTFGESALYKVYRQIGTGNWSLIATTTALEYTDEEMYFYIPGGDESPNVFYKVTAQSELPGAYESNTVSTIASKEKLDKEGISKFQPVEFSLGQNYPNPFNPTTQIQYSIKEEGLVQLRVYDILGKEIVTLVNTNKEAGYYSVDFDASQLPSGVYIYQLTTPGFTQARKMILTK